jgi:hypothetical protein
MIQLSSKNSKDFLVSENNFGADLVLLPLQDYIFSWYLMVAIRIELIDYLEIQGAILDFPLPRLVRCLAAIWADDSAGGCRLDAVFGPGPAPCG